MVHCQLKYYDYFNMNTFITNLFFKNLLLTQYAVLKFTPQALIFYFNKMGNFIQDCCVARDQKPKEYYNDFSDAHVIVDTDENDPAEYLLFS